MSEVSTRLALDLEDCVPKEHRAVGAAPVGSIIADILAVAAAVKAKDWLAAWTAVKKLIDDLTGPQAAQLKAEGAVGKINWQNVLSILGKLLPLILGGLTGA